MKHLYKLNILNYPFFILKEETSTLYKFYITYKRKVYFEIQISLTISQ